MGEVLRISLLCSREEDIRTKLVTFYKRLSEQGHSPQVLKPLFIKAIQNADNYATKNSSEHQAQKELMHEASKRRVYLKLPYHPNDPPRPLLQKLWHKLVSRPEGRLPLNQLNTNNLGEGDEPAKVPIDRLIIAYRRAPNLGNMFSYRDIANHEGIKVSSLVKRLTPPQNQNT